MRGFCSESLDAFTGALSTTIALTLGTVCTTDFTAIAVSTGFGEPTDSTTACLFLFLTSLVSKRLLETLIILLLLIL